MVSHICNDPRVQMDLHSKDYMKMKHLFLHFLTLNTDFPHIALRCSAQTRNASEEWKEKLCLHSDSVKMCSNECSIGFCCFPVCLQKYFYLCFDSLVC